jgi:YegS/Rv2252/BmrU family lipid kinase
VTVRAQVLIHNPASGGRMGADHARRVAEELGRGSGGAVELLATSHPQHAAELAEAVLRERAGAVDVLALGGDGTLNEVLLGADRAGRLDDPRGMRLGVVPAGTTNVVARALGLPRDPVRAARSLASGADRAADVGSCVLGQGERRPFLLACGAGFDAEVLHLVGGAVKRHLGRNAYWMTALRHCGDRERGLVAEAELADGGSFRGEAASIVVGCSPRYAGRLRLSRHARLDDGLLELAMLPSTRLLPLLVAGLRAMATDMRGAAGVRVEQVREVRITAACPVPVHVDAEPIGTVPATVSVLPRAVTLRVPGR